VPVEAGIVVRPWGGAERTSRAALTGGPREHSVGADVHADAWLGAVQGEPKSKTNQATVVAAVTFLLRSTVTVPFEMLGTAACT
jgi:hypothetical protein